MAQKKYSHKRMKQMMKEDEFASSVDKGIHWIKENQTLVIIAATVLIAVTGAYVFTNSFVDNKRDRSEQALAKAIEIVYFEPVAGEASPYETKEAQLNAALTELDHVMDSSPTASVAERAQYYRSDIHMQMDKADLALEDLRQLNETSSGVFKVIVAIKYAGLLEERGELQQAVDVLNKLDDMALTDALLLDYALLARGKMQLRLGETESARLAFTRIVEEFPESAYATQAQDELDKING